MWRAVLVAALAVGVATAVSTARAQTTGGVVSIGSGEATVGQTAYVNVLASDVPAPGTFRCSHEGLSPLTMTVRSWGSAIPETITPQPAIANGAITCGNTVRGLLSLGQERGTVGQEVSIDLVENMAPPGLGAWTVDMQYDPSKIEAVRCIPYEGSVCSTAYTANMERVTGASAESLVGEHTLVTYVFRCLAQSASPLTLSVNVFAYAGVDPQPITLDVANGLILCLDATPTPLLASAALPASGSAGTTAATPWLPAELVAIGVGAIVFGAAWARTRRA